MKKLFIFLAVLPFTALAQKSEIGIAGGISLNGKASTNMPFLGDKSGTNYASSVSYLFNIKDHLQLGFNMYMHELSSKNASATYNWQGNTILKGDSRKLEYAKLAASPSFVANYRISIANDAYLYGGAALGLVTTLNDSKKINSTYSYSAPSGGLGAGGGLQLGFVYGLSPRFALNAEVAMRYYYLTYDSKVPNGNGSDKLHYSIMSVPLTIGIRYRMGFAKQLNYETGKYEIIRKRKNVPVSADPVDK